MRSIIAAMLAILTMGGGALAADLDEIRERGVLRVAVAPLSPFVIRDKEGELSGYEISSTRALGDHLGVEVEYVVRPFCELADAIIEDEADIIASGYSNTERRRRLLGFSLPYHDTEYYLVLSKDAARRAKTMRGVNRDDIAIGYQEGGVSGMVAQGEFGGAALEGFSSFGEIVKALKKRKIDGAVMFSPFQEMITGLDLGRVEYMVPHEFALTRTIEAFAMDKNAEALRQALNAWVIERDLEGEWDALEAIWFTPENAGVSNPPPYACPATVPAG